VREFAKFGRITYNLGMFDQKFIELKGNSPMKRFAVLLMVVALAVAALPVSVADNTSPAPAKPFPALSECSEDLTGQTYTFYMIGDLSGPYAPISGPLAVGLADAAAYMNANGGLCGATIAIESRDTGGDTATLPTFYDEFKAKEDAYSIFLLASADGELLREQAAQDGVVLWNAAASELALYGENGDEPSWQFSIIPLYTDQLGVFCDYVAENWESMGMSGDPVIGHLSWDIAYGHTSDTDATRAYCESKGIGYAGAQYFAPGTSDVSTQLQTLLDAGANIIYTTTLATGTTAVAGTVAAANLESLVLIGGPNWVLDTSVILLGGANVIGVVGQVPYLWWDEITLEPVQIVAGYWQQNRLAVAEDPTQALAIRNVAYITSFGTLDMWAESYIRTMNEVGAANMSREALYNTLQNFQYEAFGGILRADFTDGKRAGSVTRVGRIAPPQEATGPLPVIEILTDWIPLPDLRQGGADVPQ
jgi:ABC-type branched-subunit amino acid transport system substrate-binding protein